MGGSGASTASSSSSSTGGIGGTGGGGMATCANQNTGDDTCALASAAAKTITLDASKNFSDCFAGDTSNATDDYQSPSCPPHVTTGPDSLYHLAFKNTGTLKLHVKADNKAF